ncbi:MAG: MgtC/SapB family protein [Sphingopyxis sp.]|uniref:MgtC/SapB family protein n=1 Tax=Sphingopyxis sp. TaxID=1908224 RepID=UPI002AB8BB9D|nr:MgtC/SapB family protein [Sphingopyxis sp.]MDZ3831937.1 MgtC/SapB family protein [Sphingopyxis sp.]
MEPLNPQLLWPIVAAVVTGAVIGAEREYRASPAGLRTHILVSLSCCLLMLAAVHQMAWLSETPVAVIRIDPVRMAHGILTGIGFLCGGVIFREGFNVRGLTTAASLWMTSTLGMLFGVGFFELAILGAVATLFVLAAVTITERHAPQRRIAHIKARYRRNAPVTRETFSLSLADRKMRAITIERRVEGDAREYSAIVDGYEEDRADALDEVWTNDEAVLGFDIKPQPG